MAVSQRIVVQDLVKVYGGARGQLLAVDHANLAVGASEFVCILGPSGCGKSTILNILSGLDAEYQGRAEVVGGGSTIRVSYVFQDPRLLPWLTVERNIHAALKWAGLPRESWAERTERQLERVGLA